MGLHAGGEPLALRAEALASLHPRVALFIHGLACDEHSWQRPHAAWGGERGGYPAEMSAQRLADMINARLRGIPKYKATKVTRHVIERILGRRKG